MDIIEMLRKQSKLFHPWAHDAADEIERLRGDAVRAYNAGAAAEREACAKLCEEIDRQYVAFASSAKECADRIRDRSTQAIDSGIPIA